MSSKGKEPLSLEVSLGLNYVKPTHVTATTDGADRAANTSKFKKQW